VQDPSYPNLWLLYDLLRGPCQQFHELLPLALRSRLEKQIRHISRNNELAAQSTSLLCLGVIKELVFANDGDTRDTSAQSTMCRELFADPGNKSSASLTLLTVQAAWVCSSNAKLPVAEASKLMSVAISVAVSVSPAAVSEWKKTKTAQNSLAHLVKRCLQGGFDPEVHLKVCGDFITIFRSTC
jgi:hypothetical protein